MTKMMMMIIKYYTKEGYQLKGSIVTIEKPKSIWNKTILKHISNRSQALTKSPNMKMLMIMMMMIMV